MRNTVSSFFIVTFCTISHVFLVFQLKKNNLDSLTCLTVSPASFAVSPASFAVSPASFAVFPTFLQSLLSICSPFCSFAVFHVPFAVSLPPGKLPNALAALQPLVLLSDVSATRQTACCRNNLQSLLFHF